MEVIPINELKDRIKDIREENKLSQSQFSKEILVGASTVSMWELGTRTPKEIHFSRISDRFGISEEWLKTGNGEKKTAMFIQDEYARAARELSNDEFVVSHLVSYWESDAATKKALRDYLYRVHARLNQENEED